MLFGISHDANKQDYYVAPLPSYNGDSWVDLTYSTTGTVVPGEPDDPDNPQVPEPSPGLQILKVKKGTREGLNCSRLCGQHKKASM